MSNEYLIKHISDFLTIPVDRLDDCLSEFKTAVGVAYTAKILNAAIGGPDAPFEWPYFNWIDNNKKEAHILFTENGKVQ